MATSETLEELWRATAGRLAAKNLLGPAASLSLRCPDTPQMWFADSPAANPRRVTSDASTVADEARIHAVIYDLRGDAGAIAWGGGMFGTMLGRFGGALPELFDEQIRHIGLMPPPVDSEAALATALKGGANALMLRGKPLCLGMTARRLALNAELFEKCSTAYVLAAASGGDLTRVPRWVQRIAAGRLGTDEKRAAEAFAAGRLPVDSNKY